MITTLASQVRPDMVIRSLDGDAWVRVTAVRTERIITGGRPPTEPYRSSAMVFIETDDTDGWIMADGFVCLHEPVVDGAE